MIFLPPDEFWYLTIVRLAVTCDDNSKGTGTGFFVYDSENYFLVTARHVVDPKYLPPEKRRTAVAKTIEISFQCAVNAGLPSANVGYQRFRIDDPNLEFDDDGLDLAILKIPNDVLPFIGKQKVKRPVSFSLETVATENNLA